MAAEYEELKLSVNLTDVSTAAGFARLRQSITGINTDLTQLNEAAKRVDFKKAGEQADKVGTMIKGISREVSGAITRISYVGPMLRGLQPQIESLVEKALPKWSRVPIFLGLVAIAVGESVKALGNYLNEFAKATLEMESISKEIGMSIGALKVLRDSMGVSMGRDAATRSIHGFSMAMQQIRKGTERFYDVVRAAGPTSANMAQFNQRLIALMDQGKKATALKAVQEEALKQRDQYRQMGYAEDEIARMLNAFLGVYGQTQALLDVKEFKEPTPEEKAAQEEIARKSRQFAEQWNRLGMQIGEVFDAMKVALLPAMTELADYLAANPRWADNFVENVQKTAHNLAEGYRALRPLLDVLGLGEEETFGEGDSPALGIPGTPKSPTFWLPGGAPPQPRNLQKTMRDTDSYFSGLQFADLGGGGGGRGDLGENTAELKKLNDNLYAMLNLQRGADGNVSIRGGGVAAPMGNAGPSDSGTSSSSSSTPGSSSTPPTAPTTGPTTPPQTTAYPQPAPSVSLGAPTVSGVGEGAGHPPMAPEPGLNPTPMASQTGASNPSEVVYSGATSGTSGGGALPTRGDAATGVSSMTGSGATSGGSSNAVDAMTGELKPRYNQPGAPTGPMHLRDLRAATYGAALKDPATRDKLYAYAYHEAGTHGPQAVQAFMEETLNRGMARGQSINQLLGSKAYFPGTTHDRAAGGPTEATRNAYAPILENVMGGSNLISYGTGNASEGVGFGKGGYPTFTASGAPGSYAGKHPERFGVEAQDRRWASMMQTTEPFDLASVRRAIDLPMGQEIAGNVSGSGDIKVKVERASGPAVLEADASMFLPTPSTRQQQMLPAASGSPSATTKTPAVASQ